ncbi:MAG TPA: protein phosphatase 2C domain-containing protein [Sphingomicrobium sp.]|nr:protein phosphatase 2C domain-containing protein [Sphingomicrobium sp.]
MHLECASRTHVGLKRKINEDCILVDSDRGLWAVADGMGGHEAGEVASATVIDALRRLSTADNLDSLAADAMEALRGANRQLVDLAGSGGSEKTIGSTVVGLAIGDGEFRCFWAGDSRAYRVREGIIIRLTRDHSLVQQLVDSGMLRAEDADGHVNSNVVTRAVGVAADVEVEAVSGDVRSGDRFLLASDGLTRVVDDAELAAVLDREPPEQAADTLLAAVLERGAPDNVSLIVCALD